MIWLWLSLGQVAFALFVLGVNLLSRRARVRRLIRGAEQLLKQHAPAVDPVRENSADE